MGDAAKFLSGSISSMTTEEVEVWKADFAQSCLDIFGAPVSIGSCLDKEERYYFSYCTICLAIAMKENSFFWLQELANGASPEDAAYAFAEYYEQEHGESLIPLYQGADSSFDVGDNSL